MRGSVCPSKERLPGGTPGPRITKAPLFCCVFGGDLEAVGARNIDAKMDHCGQPRLEYGNYSKGLSGRSNIDV
jgi:hypothetical protein